MADMPTIADGAQPQHNMWEVVRSGDRWVLWVMDIVTNEWYPADELPAYADADGGKVLTVVPADALEIPRTATVDGAEPAATHIGRGPGRGVLDYGNGDPDNPSITIGPDPEVYGFTAVPTLQPGDVVTAVAVDVSWTGTTAGLYFEVGNVDDSVVRGTGSAGASSGPTAHAVCTLAEPYTVVTDGGEVSAFVLVDSQSESSDISFTGVIWYVTRGALHLEWRTPSGGSGGTPWDDPPSWNNQPNSNPGTDGRYARGDHVHGSPMGDWGLMRGEEGGAYEFTGDGTVMSVSVPDWIMWTRYVLLDVIERNTGRVVENAYHSSGNTIVCPTDNGVEYRILGVGRID